MSQTTKAPFVYTYDQGVHEFSFQTITPEVLDSYFTKLEAIFNTTPPDQIVPILMYSASNMPAMQNMAARDRALRAKYKQVPFVRLAVIYDDMAHLALVNLMMRIVNLNRHMAMKMFTPRERENALAWLRR